MSRLNRIQHEYVEFIPARLEEGRLYISQKYRTATHLCCCGCGMEVVTPLNPAKWHLSNHGDTVSLHPSIGNWGFPCRSHYWITSGKIRWASAMSDGQIRRVRANDHRAVELQARRESGVDTPKAQTAQPSSQVTNFIAWLRRLW
ncbi:DUF6527 family protein [Hydrogenophaga sp.]|uniref:DUF6527 family protein n=1 Tax=Hydrogenophaga sp. TaxID=1904254 RepID=UPI003AF8E021